MAVTASIALSPSTVNAPAQVCNALLTISNSAASALNVTGVVPSAAVQGGTAGSVPVLLGLPPTGPSANLVVPATGSLVMSIPFTCTAPIATTYPLNPFPNGSYAGGPGVTPLVPLAMPQTQTIVIGATVYTNDGSVTYATTANLTVNGLVVG